MLKTFKHQHTYLIGNAILNGYMEFLRTLKQGNNSKTNFISKIIKHSFCELTNSFDIINYSINTKILFDNKMFL